MTVSKPDMSALPNTFARPADEVSDDVLVNRMRAGESAAGETLYRRYHTMLLRYCHRLVGSEHAAEEALQLSWLSVLEHLDRFDPQATPGGFKAWIFRIATNKCNDQFRAGGRARRMQDGLRLVTDQTFPDATEPLVASEQAQQVRQAIESLPENQKQVVLLRYYSGMKFSEIAKLLGCPLNTALGRMHKASLRLKELLGNIAGGESQ